MYTQQRSVEHLNPCRYAYKVRKHQILQVDLNAKKCNLVSCKYIFCADILFSGKIFDFTQSESNDAVFFGNHRHKWI